MTQNSDTICAISTAAGVGAIAVIRISGRDAFSISDKIFRSAKEGKSLSGAKSHRALFGEIVGSDGNVIDEVLATVFRGPNSFSGEDTVEIACHGSQFIQQQILQLLLDKGCRMALPGEFTQRAFLNGKMDLSQAEAVADLIASNSAASHKLALSQMRGGFSNELALLREKLLNFVSLIELELDFSEEDVEFADRQNLLNLVNDIHEKISSLANSFMMGNAIKNGIPVAIVGETNVGKSTLLNCLLNEEKAIVSDVHGTTRDVIEDTVQIDGVLFRFIDTAGIRSTDDIVENLGIERTFKKMEEANIVLMIIDSSYVIPEIRKFLDKNLAKVRDKKVVVVFNKTDIITPAKREELSSIELPDNAVKIFLSAKLSQNKQSLLDTLVHYSKAVQTEDNNVVVTNLRHYEALSRAKEAIERVKEGMEQNISGDFLSRDIRDCMHYLGEITGEITTDEVLSNVFEKFCIGK